MTFPLSQSQLSIYLACQGLDENSGNYQQVSLYRLPDSIDIKRLIAALDAVFKAHPYMLSRIVLEEGMPRVEDHSEDTWKPFVQEVDSIDEVRPTFCRTMDLLKDPLIRFEIYKTKKGNYLYCDLHHIIFDGASTVLMLDHLARAYAGETLPPEPINGFEIAEREEAQRQGEAYEEAQKWYAETFGEGAQLDSNIRPDVYDAQPQPYHELNIDLPIKGSVVKEILAKYRCADSVLFTAAFGVTLAAWNAEAKAAFSTIWNGRKGLSMNAITMSVHTMPVLVNADASQTVSGLLEELRLQISGSRSRAFYSFADCVRDFDFNPPINFGYQGKFAPASVTLRLDGIDIPAEDLRTNPPGLGLTVEIFGHEDGSQMIRFWHRPDQYSEKILHQFAESFSAVLTSMLKAETLADLQFVTAKQRKQLDRFQPAEAAIDTGKTVLDIFREHAAKTPEKVAAVYGDKRLTYAELDRLSDNLAAEINKTVKPGGVVSIILGRNEHMVTTPVAAMKAGCTYQPLDPTYPSERLGYMVQDSKAGLLIADPGLEKLVEGYKGPVLLTDKIAGLPKGKGKGAPKPEDCIILLYTSGTTGKPKGCMLSYANLLTFCLQSNKQFGLGPDSAMTGYASFGFDAFMGDMWRTLCAGATLHIIPEDIRLDLIALNDYFEKNGVTHAFMTTQVATQFALTFPRCKGLKVLSTGGEKLASITPPGFQFYNCYGPTECCCYVVSKLVEKKETNIPIGRPSNGIHAFIATKAGQLLPTGAAGELLIAGQQVGMGYLGLPEKTDEAFISNTYEKDAAYSRIYRTGDIVRWREDGDIEFIGRKDSQVKIRGFRIELKEVETVILDYPGITDVTVQAFDEEGAGAGKFLAAYVVSDQPVDVQQLNAFILERKPPYMVPAVTMQIDKIPLNVNQKVDRKALPKPQPQQAAHKSNADAPFNILEQEIIDLIRETVHIEGFSLTDPLIEYGLTSLSALRLATELYKKYGVQMNMDVFVKSASLQTIENEVLKALIEGRGAAAESAMQRVDTPQPLTFQQTGVYFDCMKAPQETMYNIPMLWTFPGEVSAQALKEAVEKVLAAHPALQSRFEQKDGQICQVPSDVPIPVSISETDLKTRKESFVTPFNLNNGPLGKVEIVPGKDKTYLLCDFHHLVFDGRSYDLFIQEICAALEGKEIAPESYNYFQYAAWQKESEGSEAYAQAREFFAGQMGGLESPSTVIPDLEHGDQPGREVFLRKFVETDIHPLCKKLGISPASFYLGAAYLTLSAYNANKRVYICTISNGRGNLKTADSFGMFVNTLALAGDCSIESTEDFLKQCDQDFQATLQHQDYPFAKVADEFDFQPQVMLAYQVGVLADYRVNGKKVTGENLDAGAAKFPLSIYIDGSEGKEAIVLGYDESKYSEALMQAFADAMECVVRGLLQHEKLNEVPFVDGDRLKELMGFNHYSQKVDTTQTIVSLFRAQAQKTPDAPAVCYEDFKCTYAEADALTDRIAAAIAAKGLKNEDVVSVLIGRNQWMALASLGILKAGCAYQPLDPSYPEERLNFMVGDASAKLLIADQEFLHILKDYKGPVLTTDKLESLPEGPVPEGPKPENLFILLYTSGSTGVPKGVMLEHRNLVNFCAWYRKYFNLNEKSRASAYASYGFDCCQMDMYPTLTSGACLYIIPEATRHDMGLLNSFLVDNGITHSFMTTQVGVMYAKNYPQNPCLQHLTVAGEKLVSMDPPSYGFHNGYGPTECTILCTIFDVLKREPNIPIGHALDNTAMFIMDKDFRLVPVGADGELLIAGDPCVGRGYLNRPEKTAEVFIENPFHKGMRAYRSGDIVRWRTDGNIEYVGRQDGQVKIRGFRVETKEVEAVIREFPGVKDVTVQPFDAASGGKFIAAYVVSEGDLDAKALSAFILERKPPYMVPASINSIDSIPLNVNQKVDRKALPAPVLNASEDYVEPANDMERTLCEVFAHVLDVERVGALDNFFDMGGSSLMVTNVMVEAEKRGIKFSYDEVFVFPTARALAARISGKKPEGGPASSAVEDIESYDYTAIDKLLAGNTLEALQGEPQPLGKHILLTGATGFLGIHILRDLMEMTPEDTTVWCLLRSKGSLTAERRLAQMLVYYFPKSYRTLIGSRIQVVEGDITRPDTLDALRATGTAFDLVINCAANVKHFSTGNDIEEINYGGVKNLVDFCEKCGARIIQVSTESVGGMSVGDTPKTFTEQQLWIGQNTDNQYVHSKFLAERLVLEHIAAGTLHGKIMRAGNLSPRAEDGEFQANFNANTTMGRIKAYRMLGACPYPLLDAKMEFSPIDQASQAIVLLAGTPDANCVFHVSNDHLLPMDDILSRIHLDDGAPIAYVEYPEFVARMNAAKEDPEKAKVLSSIIAYAGTGDGPQTLPNFALTSYTMQVLHRLGFRWSETASDYVDMIFEMLAALRYFDA